MHMRHEILTVQGKWLRSVVRGYLTYFGVRGNERPYREVGKRRLTTIIARRL